MQALNIRSGRGFGDAIYLQSIVKHLIEEGKKINVRTDFPELFRHLDCSTSEFSRADVQLISHYTDKKSNQSSKQFDDCCERVGIKTKIPLKLDWKIKNKRLVAEIKKQNKLNKKIVFVMSARSPMAREDGFGIELLPRKEFYNSVLSNFKDCFLIQIGKGNLVYNLEGIDLDLVNETSLTDVVDIASVSDFAIGYCSFVVPLFESFDKPCFIIWSEKGLNSKQAFIRTITPEKIVYKETSHFIIGNEENKLKRMIDDFKR